MITQPVLMPPGEVEVIVLQEVETAASSTVTDSEPQPEVHKRKSKVKSLSELLKNAPPVPPDFDPDEARWEALKEKQPRFESTSRYQYYCGRFP